MGLSTFEERVDKAKAKYKMRSEMIEENRWPQESCCGPIWRAKLWKMAKGDWNKMDLTIRKEGDREVVRLGERVIHRDEKALNANI